ncbi:hypothetical protein ACFL2M_02425 [Patescibacteria group bacterium]
MVYKLIFVSTIANKERIGRSIEHSNISNGAEMIEVIEESLFGVDLNGHHVVPSSRKPNGRKVRIDVHWHELWHHLFGNMTTAEVCQLVEEVMRISAEPGRKQWTWSGFLERRVRIIRRTEDLVRGRGRFSYFDPYHSVCQAPICLEQHSTDFCDKWCPLFNGIPRVDLVSRFVNRLMVPGRKRDWATIQKLQHEVLETDRVQMIVIP